MLLRASSSQQSFTSNDTSLNISINLVNTYLHSEINSLLKGYNEYGIACVRSSTMKKFVDKMYNAHYNTISTRSKLVQEMYLLHQTCKSLYLYNQQYLNFSHQEFRAKVLFPNIVYMLVRYLHKVHKFLQGIVRSVYSEISNRSKGIVQRYAHSYYLDHEIIRTDVLYEFLGNALKKFDPLTIRNFNYFYKSVFRNIFGYYFKKDYSVNTNYCSIWDIDLHVSKLINIPTRLAIYRDVLYSLQVEHFCKTSPTLDQLNYNYNIFKNVIVNNEFQDIFFSTTTDTFMLNNNHYKLMKVYYKDKSDLIIEKIKNLPIIYRLFRCVHIVNPKASPINEMLIKPDMIKTAVLEELMHPFRNLLSEQHIYPILEKISQNFTKSILSGEYINLLSLTSVRINQVSFVNQIRKFIQICLSEIV